MSRADEVISRADRAASRARKKASKLQVAAERAKRILKKNYTEAELAEIGRRVLRLSREHLSGMLTEGFVSHHVDDAYEGTCNCACFGKDYYDWIYDLQAE